MGLVTVEHPQRADRAQLRGWCEQLEAGAILYFPQTPLVLAAADISFLLGQQQADSSLHKNIAYKPSQHALTGLDTKTADDAAVKRLREFMRFYSRAVTGFLENFLAPYDGKWRLDYASFRPQEEQGRDLATRKRNDLLHTDAFPTRPTHGARILRFFNNIHPTRTRDWVIGEPFTRMVREFVPEKIAPRVDSVLGRAGKALGRAAGLGAVMPSIKRTPYDDFMMRFHNHLKEDARFQSESAREALAFPPGSSWMVYTDTVPHAVMAGQYALEQTVLVEPDALVAREHAPLAVLERLMGQSLV